ncbi:hypothetical protein [Bradyrhizobium diazoefficiens]|uniref:hypothetical protein n=1 Tax=Bradyrhizobium diazoefficiens TaxID=1355477 RepID=UPI001B758E07|nr:hypothetical protein [Bradyrhizobium japonicum]
MLRIKMQWQSRESDPRICAAASEHSTHRFLGLRGLFLASRSVLILNAVEEGGTMFVLGELWKEY